MSNRLEMFERELGMVKDEDIKGFAEFMLSKAPTYFWVVPSSSTGKYHSKQSNGTGGLVRHTKAVVYFADIFCRAFNVEGKERDIVLVASLGHDILKYGMALGKFTTKTHDKDGADFILALGKEYGLDNDYLMGICKAVAYHMGRWTTEGRAKAFPESYTKPEIIVHLADMASAGKEVNLEFLHENLIG